MAYLPPDVAAVGARLAVEYAGDRYPATVAAVGAAAVFDPANERMRA
jgi:glycine cleavage system aminomethyltransferase T